MQPLKLGDLRVDRIVETQMPFAPIDVVLPGVTPELLAEHADWLMPRFVEPGTNMAVMSFHSFVIRTPRHTILVDACVGNDKERPQRPGWHRQQKPFLQTLAAAGVRPDEIDFVLCTHLHADHVGWNTRLENGRWVPTFRNAKYVFARKEYEHWERAHRECLARGEEPLNHGSFADSVLPVMEAGKAVLVASDHEIETGIHLEPAYGHTPGTCMIHAKSRGEHGIFLGDIMHTPVQLADPRLSSKFCSDPAESARTRTAICEHYADTPTRILPAHFPDPTVGRIVRHRNAFRFQE